jgi:hypothetical protein
VFVLLIVAEHDLAVQRSKVSGVNRVDLENTGLFDLEADQMMELIARMLEACCPPRVDC